MLQLLDWIAAFIVAFDLALNVLLRVGLDPNAVIFAGGNGPPPVVLLLALAGIGLLFWPCVAYLVTRFVIIVARRVLA
jgi:hypothetical protein